MDNKGLDAKVESTIDLAPDMAGYQLRIRTITFEPGGVAGFHSHKQRPAFAYILQGSLTELRQGGYSKTLGPAASSPSRATSSIGRRTAAAPRSCWSASTS